MWQSEVLNSDLVSPGNYQHFYFILFLFKAGLRLSSVYWGNVGETERWGGAHMGFSEHLDTILNWTELNYWGGILPARTWVTGQRIRSGQKLDRLHWCCREQVLCYSSGKKFKGNFVLQDDLGPDVGQSPLVQEFSCHADKLCQVAAMASASSMDPKSKQCWPSFGPVWPLWPHIQSVTAGLFHNTKKQKILCLGPLGEHLHA